MTNQIVPFAADCITIVQPETAAESLPAQVAIIAEREDMAKSAKSLDALQRMVVTLATVLSLFGVGRAEDAPRLAAVSLLDHGFSSLYNLDFAGAQRDFAARETQHPDDPVGPVSEAAGCLFSEFNRLGVLEAQFYENDEAFAGRPKLTPDPAVRERFLAAIGRAQNLAQFRLAKNGKDRDSLFAMTLSAGLQADYAALIEKRNLASQHFTKEASIWAQQLLAVCQDCYDALLANGFSKYIIASMAAPIRWILRLGGLPADKDGGIADLETTARRGHYLRHSRAFCSRSRMRGRTTKPTPSSC